MSRTWQSEFGEGYNPGPEVLEALARYGYEDESWHNDASPRFMKKLPSLPTTSGERILVLWVDHPDKDQREVQGKRYTFVIEDSDDEKVVLYEAEDMGAAARFIHTITPFLLES
jgi:hypothetical protein